MRNKKRAASIKNKKACRKWKALNPDKIKDYNVKNKDRIKLWNQAYYLKVKEELIRDVFYGIKAQDRVGTKKQEQRKYYLENRQKFLTAQRKYYLKNIEKVRARKRKYTKEGRALEIDTTN